MNTSIGSKSQMIAESLGSRILSGEISGRLPAEQELAKQFCVSPVTAAKALNILRDRGVVKRVARWGTFTVPQEKVVLKIRFSDGDMIPRFTDYVGRKFPQVEIEPVSQIEKVDAAICSSTLSFFPGEYFLSWPRERVARLRADNRFFPQVFEFFAVGGVVWGIPFVFSPVALLYNKELMRRVDPDFAPYALTYEKMLDLQKKLPAGVRFGSGRGESLMLSFIYDLSAGGQKGLDVYRKAVEMLSAFDFYGTYEDFSAGRTLFTTGFRSKLHRLGSRFDVCPMPEVNGFRLCHTASQTFWVRNTTEHADLLFDIGESLFDDAFQQSLAAARINIPAAVSAAVPAMDSRVFRDDIFFNEIRNMDFSHRHMFDSVSSCFSGSLKKLVCCHITPEEFLSEIEESFRFEEKRRHALQMFFSSQDA